MNIFAIISHLYTDRTLNWLDEVEDNDTAPFLVQRWLAHDDKISEAVRWLDKYTFELSLQQYLSLAWSIIPKSNKAPFIKYIKTNKDEEEFEFIIRLIRKHFEMADNDFKANRKYILEDIKKNMIDWFKFYGIEKKYWNQYHLNFEEMRKEEKKQVGLDVWS